MIIEQVYDIPDDLPNELWRTVDKLNFLLEELFNKNYKVEVRTDSYNYMGKPYSREVATVLIYKEVKAPLKMGVLEAKEWR